MLGPGLAVLARAIYYKSVHSHVRSIEYIHNNYVVHMRSTYILYMCWGGPRFNTTGLCAGWRSDCTVGSGRPITLLVPGPSGPDTGPG